jgi:hypothetical protein
VTDALLSWPLLPVAGDGAPVERWGEPGGASFGEAREDADTSGTEQETRLAYGTVPRRRASTSPTSPSTTAVRRRSFSRA